LSQVSSCRENFSKKVAEFVSASHDFSEESSTLEHTAPQNYTHVG